MSEAHLAGCAGVAIRFESERAVALRAAGWLGLGAAPTFAVRALVTAALRSGAPDMLCSAMHMPRRSGEWFRCIC